MNDENKIDDGGFAFPCDATMKQFPTQEGMTLRDWFAGQVIHSCLNNPQHTPEYFTEAAIEAYKIADEMIAARKTGR